MINAEIAEKAQLAGKIKFAGLLLRPEGIIWNLDKKTRSQIDKGPSVTLGL